MKKKLLIFSLILLLLPTVSQASPARMDLRGKILLQVEENGEAWYIKPEDGQRIYMKDGNAAYGMMRDLGLGITNIDLSKIPIGFEDRFECLDSDGDGLCNKLEDGLGTDKNNADSDGDGYNDGVEIRGDYNPLGSGKLNYDFNLINRLKGKILLQVESNGEAWYINPDDNKRYYMPDGPSAYQIMRFLSLGITNDNLAKIDVEEGGFNVINYNPEINNEDLLVYNNPSLDFIVKYPSRYTEINATVDNKVEEGVSFMEVKGEDIDYITIIKNKNALEEENINNLEELGIFLENEYVSDETYKIEKNIAINGKLFIYDYTYDGSFRQMYYTIINNEFYILSFSILRSNISLEEVEVQKKLARSIVETFELR